jgi:hypothetical protein
MKRYLHSQNSNTSSTFLNNLFDYKRLTMIPKIAFVIFLFAFGFNTAKAQSTLCASSPTTFGYEYISSVTFNGVTKTGDTGYHGPGYIDYTGTNLTNLVAGQSYPISVTVQTNGQYLEYVKIWFDFNGNQNLTDAGELVFNQNFTFTGVHTYTGTITIPTNAFNGAVYMRVNMVYSVVPTLCGSYTYGNTFDYKSTISGGIIPRNLAVTTAGTNGATGSVVSSPAGINTASGINSSNFNDGSVVNLTATSNGANVFTGWAGSATSTTNPLSVTMDAAKTITANFAAALGVTTNAVSAITGTTATSGGTVTGDGGSAITARGVCWNTTGAPTIANSKTADGTGVGAYVSSLTGLSPATTYFVRAYATNGTTTNYGNQVSFTTKALPPLITSLSPASVSPASPGVITVTGANFGNSLSDITNVTYGANGAGASGSSIQWISPSVIRFTPGSLVANTAYKVIVTVLGQSSQASAVAFTAAPTPIITAISPADINPNSATTLTLSGLNFGSQAADITSITYGPTGTEYTATGINWISATQASFVTNTSLSAGSVKAIISVFGQASAASAITVNPLPVPTLSAGGSTTICSGSTVTLTADPGFTYQWFLNENVIGEATADTYTASQTGKYTVQETNAWGGSAISASSIDVYVNQPPVAAITASGPTTFCPTGSVTLTAGAGASYLWSTGATTPSINATSTGNYTVTVTNDSGCSATSAPTAVLVQDLVSPVFTSTQANTIVALDATTGTATLTDYTSSATATDNCSVSGITQFPLAGTALANNMPVTVTLTATDPSGNSATQSFTVTATDQTAPVAATKNITVSLDASGNVSITAAAVDNGSTDNVGITTYSLDKTTFDCTNVGANTVNLTLSDAAGNTSTASAEVTVQDNVPPIAIAQAITVQLDATGNAVITAAQINNGSTDNCAIATYSLDKTTFDCSNVGANTVTLTVTDTHGNASTATAVVTVQDNVPPVVIAQNITVQLDATGNAVITAAQVNNGSTDNCAIATYTLDKTTFDCSNVGANTVTLTVTDIHGNASTATAVVSIQDNVPPIAIAQAITVQLDATGKAVITAAQINNGSTDNCAIATYSLDKTTFDCSNVGANTVTLTVTDTHGNASTATAVVTVQDNVPPVVIAQNITVQLDATGNAVITAAQVNNGSTDNCAIATYTLDKSTFDCSNVGANTVTLTVTDIHGNASTATAVVSIQDNVPPIAIAQAVTVQLDPTGKATITPAQINNNSTDNCAISTYALDKATFDCSNVGANTVTLTVTDIHGNASIATAVVTVQDNIPPIAIAQAITVQLDAAGKATVAPAQINNGSTDNCAIASYALDKSTFDCSNVGANTVTLTVTDIHGNASTATSVVTVQDNIKPTAIVQNITVQLDATGKVTITPSQVNNGSFDNCTIADYTLDKMSFDCTNIGANTVTLTVTDTHGNISTATAVVTVQDNVPPVVLTKNITVYLSGGNATITPEQIDNGSNDACGIKSISLNKTTFDCSTQGANTVTLTVTDNHGNVSTGTAVVTVIGKTPNPSIAVSRTDNTYTKLNATTIALGYGAQKLTLTASNPNSAPGASTYKWSPSAGLSNTNIANPVFTPTQAGSYTFNVLVTSEYGCQASTSVTITVIDVRCGDDGKKVSMCFTTNEKGEKDDKPGKPLCVSTNAVDEQFEHGGNLCACACEITKSDQDNSNGSDNHGTKDPVTLTAYPNPFGKRTTVSFTVPAAEQNVTLEVYNTLGKKVASLYSGKAAAKQTYSLPFDGTRLLFGVYFVRLTTSTGVLIFRLSMLE